MSFSTASHATAPPGERYSVWVVSLCRQPADSSAAAVTRESAETLENVRMMPPACKDGIGGQNRTRMVTCRSDGPRIQHGGAAPGARRLRRGARGALPAIRAAAARLHQAQD